MKETDDAACAETGFRKTIDRDSARAKGMKCGANGQRERLTDRKEESKGAAAGSRHEHKPRVLPGASGDARQ